MKETGWNIDTLHEHVQVQLDNMRALLDERYATQTKALDAAFIAQQTAMRTALEAAEKAVQTAMVAAEKAVSKAENSAEKRFESVNEFRGQLADQARDFMTKSEADIKIGALKEQIDKLQKGQERGLGKQAGIGATLTLGATVVTIVIAAIALFLTR